MRICDWSSDVCSSELDPPMLGNDGQLLNGPALQLLVVGFGRSGFYEMADAPGDSDAGTVETAFTALRGAENPANVFALGGLLAQEQPHIRPSDSRGSWSCWDRACRDPPRAARSEERRVGKEWVRQGR